MQKLTLPKPSKDGRGTPPAANPAKEKRARTVKAGKAAKGGGGKKKRFVLMIGDEGAILILLEGRTVLKRVFSASADSENIGAFRQLFESYAGAAVYALVDMMDQSYVKHTLPPVTKISVNKLIRRRLERDFGPEDISGALPLGREPGGRKDWNYLMVSLAGSPALLQWIDFLLEQKNPLEGIYLAPVESGAFLKELSRHKLGKEAHPWQLLVCHNKVGGFRQVIMRDGKLTFTRLAQPLSDTSPEVIAGNIEQEIGNTIEYLRRLSYSDDAGLDCFLIVANDIKSYIEPAKIKATQVFVFTPFEAGESLKLSGAAQPEDHYADVVFSSFFGLNPKKVLPLHSRISKLLYDFRHRAKLAMKVSAALASCGIAFMLYNGQSILPQQEEADMLKQQLQSLNMQIADATARNQKELPADIDRIGDIVSLHKLFDKDQAQLLDFVRQFHKMAQGEVIVRRLTWKDGATLETRFSGQPATAPGASIAVDVEVEFVDSSGLVDDFARRARDFFTRCRNAFPQLVMKTSQLPGIIDQAQAFKADFKEGEEEKRQDMLSGDPIVVTLQFTTPDPNQSVQP